MITKDKCVKVRCSIAIDNENLSTQVLLQISKDVGNWSVRSLPKQTRVHHFGNIK